MALTKQVVIDKIEILEDETIQYRLATRVFDDGVLIGENYHRLSPLTPGDSLVGIDARVRAIANLLWTPAVVNAAAAKRAASQSAVAQTQG